MFLLDLVKAQMTTKKKILAPSGQLLPTFIKISLFEVNKTVDPFRFLQGSLRRKSLKYSSVYFPL